MSKYGVFSGSYFPPFGLNTEIYHKSPYSVGMRETPEPEKTPYLDTYHAVLVTITWICPTFDYLENFSIFRDLFRSPASTMELF